MTKAPVMQINEKLQRKIEEVMRGAIAEAERDGRKLQAEQPLLVREHGGPGSYWRVPVKEVASGRWTGFFDLREDPVHPDEYALVRYGVTSLSALNADRSPDVTELTWDNVVREARTLVGPEAIPADAPTLAYLGFDTRIAWKVRMIRPDGTAIDVFVTPGAAFFEP